MFCQVTKSLLPHFHMSWLRGNWLTPPLTPSFFSPSFLVWLFCLTLSCQAIGRSASLLKQSKYNLNSVQEYSTGDGWENKTQPESLHISSIPWDTEVRVHEKMTQISFIVLYMCFQIYLMLRMHFIRSLKGYWEVFVAW